MMHLNNSIRYKRSFVNINPQSNTDFTQVTCTVHLYNNGDQRNQIVKTSTLPTLQIFEKRGGY
jgi:hypothetical protein